MDQWDEKAEEIATQWADGSDRPALDELINAIAAALREASQASQVHPK